MNLVNKLFPKAVELATAHKAIEALTVERENLKQRLEALSTDYRQSEAAKNGFRAELEAAKTKLREQNDADLMLVSARIVLDTLKGKKPEQNDLMLQSNLLRQQAALGSVNYGYGSGLQALGLGLGGIFGAVAGPFNH